MIPRILHQTWKSKNIPRKWIPLQKKLLQLHPGWEYRLWTDSENEVFVKKLFPDFYPVYASYPKNIMRADVIRYLIMYHQGGVYLDLDYELLEPLSLDHYSLFLPMNRSLAEGDDYNGLGNCFFASEPRHVFWKDVIRFLQESTAIVTRPEDVIQATGPLLLTRVFYQGHYPDATTPERMVYHPPSPRNAGQERRIRQNGISKGIHHTWGSWRERYSRIYWKEKIRKLFHQT